MNRTIVEIQLWGFFGWYTWLWIILKKRSESTQSWKKRKIFKKGLRNLKNLKINKKLKIYKNWNQLRKKCSYQNKILSKSKNQNFNFLESIVNSFTWTKSRLKIDNCWQHYILSLLKIQWCRVWHKRWLHFWNMENM